MKKLYISDLDGTLLGTDSKVSDKSARIISELSRRGVAITVATARTPATVDVLLNDVETDIPAIVMTGAALWDRKTHRYIDPILLPSDVSVQAVEAFGAEGINPFVYILGDTGKLEVCHASTLNRCEDAFYQPRRRLAGKRFILDDSDIRLATPPAETILIFATGDAPKIEAVAERLKAIGSLSVSCYRDIFDRSTANIEVFGAGVSKAAAIKRLATLIGADRVTVYGDNLNDLSMFEVADESVAVANAVDEVRSKADRIIGANSDDAVAADILRQEPDK